MITHLVAKVYVMILGLSMPSECLFSTFLRQDFVTQWYTLFTQSQCALLLVLWCQDDHSSQNSLMMKERSCEPYSSKVVTSRFARYWGIAVETFTDPCD